MAVMRRNDILRSDGPEEGLGLPTFHPFVRMKTAFRTWFACGKPAENTIPIDTGQPLRRTDGRPLTRGDDSLF